MSRRRTAGRRPPWWQERLEYAAFRLGMGLLALLGRRAGLAVVGKLARVAGPFTRSARHAEESLARFRPELSPEARRRMVRDVLENFTRTMIEYLHLDRIAAGAAGYRVEGLEHLLAAQAKAGGRVVFAGAHYGNWEAVRAVAALHGAAPAIVYRAFNNHLVETWCREYLTSTGWPAFTKGRDGARELYRHVRNGGSAMILVDHRLGGAPLLDFLGEPAETSLAAAQLSRKLGAPLLPACARREGDSFVVRFEPPAPDGPAMAMTQYVNDRIAEWVSAAPEQWFWLHRRWRIRNLRGGRARKFEDAPTPPEGG